ALAAHPPPELRRARTHRSRLQPPARRGRPDGRPGADHRPRPPARRRPPRRAHRRRANAGRHLPRADGGRRLMTEQGPSQLLKRRSTETTLYLLLGMVGLVALATALHVFAPSPSSLTSLKHQLQVFEVGTRIGILFASIAGALAITAEIRYGTI